MLLVAGQAGAVTIEKWDCPRAVAELPPAVRAMQTKAEALLKVKARDKRPSAVAAVILAVMQAESLLDSFNWHCGWDEKGRAAYKDMSPRVEALRARLDAANPKSCNGPALWPFNCR